MNLSQTALAFGRGRSSQGEKGERGNIAGWKNLRPNQYWVSPRYRAKCSCSTVQEALGTNLKHLRRLANERNRWNIRTLKGLERNSATVTRDQSERFSWPQLPGRRCDATDEGAMRRCKDERLATIFGVIDEGQAKSRSHSPAARSRVSTVRLLVLLPPKDRGTGSPSSGTRARRPRLVRRGCGPTSRCRPGIRSRVPSQSRTTATRLPPRAR